jgi:type I restriction enzyme M protein
MALKKSDLYRYIWQSCDELRGGMDASQYKDYVLTLLFVKYVTDKSKRPDSLIEVPEGGSFDDMAQASGDPEIGDRLNKIIGTLADANDLRGVIDLADFADDERLGKGKEMVDRLSKLVAIFNDLDFSGSTAEGDDLLGDAYEYLMRHFATESGKSKGQFYTPAEVSRILAKVVGIGPETRRDQTVYDPTCGSGSLLLKAAAEAPNGLTIYGQEKDNATWALARMNAILHDYETADIRKGDTITNPQFTKGEQLQSFDFVVANPPFSIKSWSNGLENEYGRFDGFGRPPDKNGDFAFLLHIVKSVKSTGRAAVILPHGVLFRGHAEAAIRTSLIKRGYIKGVIGLPANLFYGTSIPACIVVLDKAGAQDRHGVFMIDASKGFVKDGPKNRLRSQDIHKIVDVFTRELQVERYSRMVPAEEIASDANDFNLNIPRYIDSSEPEDLQNLDAHLNGGIPERDIDALDSYWGALPALRSRLFSRNRPGYVDLSVDPSVVQATILGSDDFNDFAASAYAAVANWFEAHRPSLETIDSTTRPNDLVAAIGDDLLGRFKSVPLLDEYDVYERLLTYWHRTMHDDVFLIMHSGWREAAAPRPVRIVGKGSNSKPKYEDSDLVVGSGRHLQKLKMDLIPPPLVVDRFFAGEQATIQRLTGAAKAASVAVDEFVDEHTVEDGLLAAAVEDDAVTKKSLAERLKVATAEDGADPEEVKALERLADLFAHEARAKKTLKDAQSDLDRRTLEAYEHLTEDDVRGIVLDGKWKQTLLHEIAETADDVVRALVARIEQLGERYVATQDELQSKISSLDERIAEHLAAMGVR